MSRVDSVTFRLGPGLQVIVDESGMIRIVGNARLSPALNLQIPVTMPLITSVGRMVRLFELPPCPKIPITACTQWWAPT